MDKEKILMVNLTKQFDLLDWIEAKKRFMDRRARQSRLYERTTEFKGWSYDRSTFLSYSNWFGIYGECQAC